MPGLWLAILVHPVGAESVRIVDCLQLCCVVIFVVSLLVLVVMVLVGELDVVVAVLSVALV